MKLKNPLRTMTAAEQDQKRLERSKLELAELECSLEATLAHRDMLRARIARLEANGAEPIHRGIPARPALRGVANELEGVRRILAS
ncbi:hypothetical protein [Paraburkholderia sp. BCC1876]|uniref:hypothetical protein n=1 Tax=Paraburkholderia sp. BCC1876 TaxID=2676303 RepID=UPI001591E6D8|nr:hypothetical protein [Paraburkholderia sp. BCC1876]